MSPSFPVHPAMLLPSFVAAAAVALVLVVTQDWHLHLTGDHPESGPQKLHTEATSRIGGLAVLVGLVAGMTSLCFTRTPELHDQFVALRLDWLLAGLLPLFALGLVEDIRKTVSVRLRLGVSLVAGALAYSFAGVSVRALGLPFVDELLSSPSFGPLLAPLVTLVAVAGLVHAMNIVDGLNGLLGGLTLVILGVLASVSARWGETGLMLLALSGMGATGGFLVFNFPRARIFCGDAGAYLIGYLVSVIAILLVMRQPAISPWFAMAVVMHPVTETLYSVWRRYRGGMKATEPDAKHMHSLWAARLRQRCDATGESVWLGVNAGASLRTLALASLPTLLASIFPTHTVFLQLICAAYLTVFVITTRMLDRSSGIDSLPALISNDIR